MKSLCSPRLLLPLLLISLALNCWQLFRAQGEPEEGGLRSKTAASGLKKPVPPAAPGVARRTHGDPGAALTESSVAAQALPPEQQTEDQLIYGVASGESHEPVHGKPSGNISRQRLDELAKMPPSKAEKFLLRARLLLPGDRALEFGEGEVRAGQRIKLERLKEFPFFTGITLASAHPVPDSSFPVTPTTPVDFEFRNRGLEIDLDITAAPGALVLGGSLRQTVFEGFSRMPGELFSPMHEGDVVLSDNKVLQPQFATRENPFIAAATAGQPCLVPVRMSFGQTFLELTCTPVE